LIGKDLVLTLGLKMEKLIQKNKNIIGIVLGHHGLFTWGNTMKNVIKFN
jgi:rhamnose utilization protein RhaD (predicted bifunctional aldolase and dehydrogenase)